MLFGGFPLFCVYSNLLLVCAYLRNLRLALGRSHPQQLSCSLYLLRQSPRHLVVNPVIDSRLCQCRNRPLQAVEISQSQTGPAQQLPSLPLPESRCGRLLRMFPAQLPFLKLRPSAGHGTYRRGLALLPALLELPAPPVIGVPGLQCRAARNLIWTLDSHAFAKYQLLSTNYSTRGHPLGHQLGKQST